MTITGTAKLLRIYTGNSDLWHGKSLHSAILSRARQEGIAGGTVLTGIEGYGAHSRIHSAALLDLSTNLPVVIELIDSAEKMEQFLPIVREMVSEGLIIMQDVEIK